MFKSDRDREENQINDDAFNINPLQDTALKKSNLNNFHRKNAITVGP